MVEELGFRAEGLVLFRVWDSGLGSRVKGLWGKV